MPRKINPSTTLKELEKRLGFSLNLRHGEEKHNRKVRSDKQVKTFRKEQSRQK